LFKIILLRGIENLLSSISGLGGVAAVLDFMGGVGAEHRKGAILARPGQAELGPAMASERGAGGRPSSRSAGAVRAAGSRAACGGPAVGRRARSALGLTRSSGSIRFRTSFPSAWEKKEGQGYKGK